MIYKVPSNPNHTMIHLMINVFIRVIKESSPFPPLYNHRNNTNLSSPSKGGSEGMLHNIRAGRQGMEEKLRFYTARNLSHAKA